MNIIIFCIVTVSCKEKHIENIAKKVNNTIKAIPNKIDTEIYSTPPKQLVVNEENYLKAINHIETKRKQLNEDEALSNIQYFVADSLATFWYGTPWDFNGISTIPNQGKIACGYFVYTLLEDAGFKLQRIKLSQAASETSIKALIPESSIQRFSNVSKDTVIEK
ncbi:MAG: hypothetical protein LRY27_04010 [Chitinophagales bacterium]|nr:hypothetical protein [Chitinophagales bacterium]